eukprot:scaffold21.g2176.t1
MAEFRKLRVEMDDSQRRSAIDPPGYDPKGELASSSSGASQRGPAVSVAQRQAALMAQAKAPFKQVAMLCFMMWMSGSQLHLFSIMTTISGLYQPLSAVLRVKEAFPTDPGTLASLSMGQGKLDTTLPRITYCFIHGLGILFAIYKINGMGLFPTHLSDWVSSIKAPTYTERAVTSIL